MSGLISAQTWCGTMASVFDPATLALTGWWRGSYSGSPWNGTASAGGSGSRSLSEATNPPATGNAVNGFTPADYDGSNDRLGGLGQAPFMADLFGSGGAGSYAILFYADTAHAVGSGDVYDNAGLLMQEGGTAAGNGCSFSTAGFKAGHYDNVTWGTVTIACGTGAWHLGQVKWDSTNLYARIDSGSWSSIARGAMLVGGYVRLGTKYNLAEFFDGRMMEFMAIDSALSDAQFDNVKSYINARYALSL